MTPLILACSGPGAMRLIQDNILYAQQHALVVGAIAILSIMLWLVIRRWIVLPFCVALLLILHPAWTVSAISGDCGFFKAGAAMFVTVLAGVCLLLQGAAWIWPVLYRRAK